MKYYIEVGGQELELEVTYQAELVPATFHHLDESELEILDIECENTHDVLQAKVDEAIEEQLGDIMDACWEDYYAECAL